MSYFLDTYALIEIVKGNKNFKEIVEKDVFTSIFNLYEFHFLLLRDFNENAAKEYFIKFKQFLITYSDEDIFRASDFKLKNKNKGFSYVDSLGYVLCLKNNLEFVTGDSAFKGMKSVLFIK